MTVEDILERLLDRQSLEIIDKTGRLCCGVTYWGLEGGDRPYALYGPCGYIRDGSQSEIAAVFEEEALKHLHHD